MGNEYRRKVFKKGGSHTVSIPHELLYQLEHSPAEYDVIWHYDNKAKKTCVRFELREREKGESTS